MIRLKKYFLHRQLQGGTPFEQNSTAGFLHSRDEPLPPHFTLCLESLWTDQSFPSTHPADKAFLAKDVLGQTYFCYLISSKVINPRRRDMLLRPLMILHPTVLVCGPEKDQKNSLIFLRAANYFLDLGQPSERNTRLA